MVRWHLFLSISSLWGLSSRITKWHHHCMRLQALSIVLIEKKEKWIYHVTPASSGGSPSAGCRAGWAAPPANVTLFIWGSQCTIPKLKSGLRWRWGGGGRQRSPGYGHRDSLLWAGSRRRLLQGKEFALLIFNQVSPTQIYLYYIHCVMGLVLLSSKSFLHEKIQIMKVFLEHATMQFHKD